MTTSVKWNCDLCGKVYAASKGLQRHLQGRDLSGNSECMKADPAAVRELMKKLKAEDGSNVFRRNDILTVSQIKSWFGGRAAIKTPRRQIPKILRPKSNSGSKKRKRKSSKRKSKKAKKQKDPLQKILKFD